MNTYFPKILSEYNKFTFSSFISILWKSNKMKQKVLAIVFILFVHFTISIEDCSSQWVKCDSGLIGDVYSLAVIVNNLFAGTGDSGVYLSTDNGMNWTQTALNNKFIYTLAISGKRYIFFLK